MIHTGQKNTLTALRYTSVGMYLGDDEGNDVLLPNKYVPDDLKEEDSIEVFIYRDSEDRIIATNLEPYIYLNEFAYLKVNSVSAVGAFMDMGLEKDLLVPFREQTAPLDVDKWATVCLLRDPKTDRLVGSCHVNRYLEFEDIELTAGEQVQILVYEHSDLGYNVIINNKYRGLIYANEVFQEIRIGKKLTAYIKTVREDNNIDVSLQPVGQDYETLVGSATEKIIQLLQKNNGFSSLTDASEPALIYARLEMSKKNFKKAIGALYRERKIRIETNGIYLV
jgi:uncharacterized protein